MQRVGHVDSTCVLWQIVTLTLETQLGEGGKYPETIRQIASYMDRWLDAHRQYQWNIMVRIRQKVREASGVYTAHEVLIRTGDSHLTVFFVLLIVIATYPLLC